MSAPYRVSVPHLSLEEHSPITAGSRIEDTDMDAVQILMSAALHPISRQLVAKRTAIGEVAILFSFQPIHNHHLDLVPWT